MDDYNDPPQIVSMTQEEPMNLDMTDNSIKNGPLISIIIPVYNVEPYVRKCMESLLGQTYPNIELLVIDDGSPDRSMDIVRELAADDPRVRIFDPGHQGLSKTRNYGVRMAKGEYLMFVDSDDSVEPDYCLTPLSCALSCGADLVMFDYLRERDGQALPSRFKNGYPEGEQSLNSAIDLLFGPVGTYAWNKLFKKELFDGVLFPADRVFEDKGTIYQTLLKAQKICYLNQALYHYRFRPGSIMTIRSRKARTDQFEMTMLQTGALEKTGYPKDKIDEQRALSALLYCVNIAREDSDNYRLAEKLLREAKKIPDSATFDCRVMFVLFRYCRPLFEAVCMLTGRRLS